MADKKIKVKTNDKTLKGFYANLMQVLHTKEEFVMDFFLISLPEGVLVSRIIISPGHFKRMIRSLTANLEKYEKRFGQVKEAETSEVEIE